MEKTTIVRHINDEYRRVNTRVSEGTTKHPYGVINMPRNKSLPNGLFMLTDGETVFPSVHGMTAEKLLKPQRLCISVDCTEYNPSFHFVETEQEIYLVNTGADTLRAGENFYVALPDNADSMKQRELSKSSYGSTFGPQFDHIAHELWGGVLAVRSLGGSSVLTEFLRRVQELPDGIGLHEIVSPYTTKGIFGVSRMLAATTVIPTFPNGAVDSALDMITGRRVITPQVISTILAHNNVKYFVNEMLRAMGELLPILTGLGGGVVLRPATGHTTDPIYPGDGFYAKITRLGQL